MLKFANYPELSGREMVTTLSGSAISGLAEVCSATAGWEKLDEVVTNHRL